MASVQVECKICFEDYDSQSHRPLSLDCGHTFCELCIRNLGHGNNKICPTCRKLTNKSTDQLAVIFALIPSQESTTERSNLIDVVGDKCNDHGCVLDRFCAECGEMVCRKCVKNYHVTHRCEFLDDILYKDPEAATLTTELENKIEDNIESLSTSMSVSAEICKIIDELSCCKKAFEDWRNKLSSHKKVAEQHLKDWNDARNKCSREKQQIIQNLCHQWKGVVLPPRPDDELTSLTKKLEELNKCAAYLQEFMQKPEDASERKRFSNASEDFLNDRKWLVASDEHSQAAISSVRAGKIPSDLMVVSWPRAPIQKLLEVLNVLGPACADGSISVVPLDTFWAPSSTTDSEHLQAFIEKFGRKIWGLYGSPDEVVTLCRVNPELREAGVRLASLADVNQCSTLSIKPSDVCCIQSLPAAARARMLELGWEPSGWHFPDAKAGSVDWMISLMEPVPDFTYIVNYETFIYLPRCSLNQNDFRALLKKCSKYPVSIYCEHSSLPASVKSALDSIARDYGDKISIQWSIPLNDF